MDIYPGIKYIEGGTQQQTYSHIWGLSIIVTFFFGPEMILFLSIFEFSDYIFSLV